MNQFYTGVGSRSTPEHILQIMTHCAQGMAAHGYVLRSGGAIGADRAFAAGCGPMAEIYRPQGDRSMDTRAIVGYPVASWDKAMDIAANVHPAWYRCSEYAKALHARNCFQVLGYDLETPSRIVICWTPDGAESQAECTRNTGGTGTAIKIAELFGVEVCNIQKPHQLKRITDWLYGE